MSAAVASATNVSAARRGSAQDSVSHLVRRHLRVGWFLLLAFLTLGLVLETLHGFKVQAYLNMINETRRLMWTLAHAHGTALGVVHLTFAFSVNCVPSWPQTSRTIASYSLIAASLLMPAGFFLGGVWVYAGDPGLGILLVPVGGILLFVAVLLAACSLKHFPIENRGGRNLKSQISNPK
jgi:hypothetical protein